MMGGFAALAIDPIDGDLWVGSVYSAGKIRYTELATELNPDGTPNLAGKLGWYQRNGAEAYVYNFGDQWCGSAGHVNMWVDRDNPPFHGWVDTPCTLGSFGGPPVFPVPSPGDRVDLNAVTVTPDGKSWWSSPTYGIASFDGRQFRYFSPAQAGTSSTVNRCNYSPP